MEYNQFCLDNLIFAYPSISIFTPDRNTGFPYDGPRDAPQVVSYIAYTASKCWLDGIDDRCYNNGGCSSRISDSDLF